MAMQETHGAREFNTNVSSVHVTGSSPRESSTSQLSSQTVINNPFTYMDQEVWEWFLNRGLFRSARSLGDVSGHVADFFEIDRDDLRIHFSFDGPRRYAIVVRIPVRGSGSLRYEMMEEVEDEFYRSLREALDSSRELRWLENEISLAFLPG